MPNGDPTGAGGFSSYNSSSSSSGRVGGSGDIGGGGSSSFAFNIPGIENTNAQLSALTDNLNSLKATVTNLGNSQAQMSGSINSLMTSATNSASSANRSINAMAGGSMGSSSFTTASGIPYANGGNGSAMRGALQYGFGGSSLGGLGGITESIMELLSSPIKFAYDRIEENRYNAMGMAQALGPVASLTNRSIPGLIRTFANDIPVQGGINDILAATQIGAATGYGNFDTNRSGSYFTALREMQTFTPGVGAGTLAAQFSSHLGNTQAQQRSMMLTGGAMSSFTAGGRPKTLTEWAEGLLKFFQNQRPGSDRGKPFKREEFETQMFPGSNMDAWMNVNGVPDYMRNYFWQYGMTKAAMGGTGGGPMDISNVLDQRKGDLSYERLRQNSAASRREFELTGSLGITGMFNNTPMYDQYMRRENADRGFMDMLRYLDKTLGSVAGPFGNIVASYPTVIADTSANLLTKTMPNVLGNLVGFFGDTPGNYGAFGGTSTANMDPSFGSKVEAMMAANPNLQITSGFRDGGLQGKLHAAGVGMVAPAGQSMHSKGLAADLGPESEFGWIVANAHRFGLESGAGFGEPWHVGAPGTIGMSIGDPRGRRGIPIGDWPSWGDIGKVGGSALGNLVLPGFGGAIGGAAGGLLGEGVDAAGGIKALFELMSSFLTFPMNLMGGVSSFMKGDFSSVFGGSGLFDLQSLGGNVFSGIGNLVGLPDIFNPAKMASGEAKFNAADALSWLQGGILSPQQQSSVDWSQTPSPVTGSLGGGTGAGGGTYSGGSTGPAELSSIFTKYNNGTAVGGAQLNDQQKGGVLQALNAAAQAGFKGDELVAIAAIAGRESSWNASAHRSTRAKSEVSGDRGMWQINYLHDDNLVKAGIIPSNDPAGRSALFDANVNARAAHHVAGGGTNFGPWAYGAGGWGTGPPLYKAAKYVEPVYNIAKQAGFIGDPRLGAIGAGPTSAVFSPYSMTSLSSMPVEFHNTFHVTSTGGEVDLPRLAQQISGTMVKQQEELMARAR